MLGMPPSGFYWYDHCSGKIWFCPIFPLLIFSWMFFFNIRRKWLSSVKIEFQRILGCKASIQQLLQVTPFRAIYRVRNRADHYYYFATYNETWEPNHPLNWVRCFTWCLPAAFPFLPMCVQFTFLNVKFFPSNCSKLAVECDWINKFSQNVWNLGSKMSFRCICEVFWLKTVNFRGCKNWKKKWRNGVLKKRFYKKSIFIKKGRSKICRW